MAWQLGVPCAQHQMLSLSPSQEVQSSGLVGMPNGMLMQESRTVVLVPQASQLLILCRRFSATCTVSALGMFKSCRMHLLSRMWMACRSPPVLLSSLPIISGSPDLPSV